MASQTHHRTRLTREERLGLIVAALAHVGLVGWLALEPPGKPVLPPPERMTVSLAEDVALTATSPEPAAATPDLAPRLGEPAAELEPMIAPEPQPELLPEPVPPRPAPQPAPAPRPVPKPVAKPVPRPAAKPAPAPRPARPAPKPAPKAAEKPASKPAAKAAARDERDRRRPDAPSGGSRIGSDFLKGVSSSSDDSGSSRSAASAPGPSAASLSQAIARKLKPHWTAPQGADADKLVTVLAWELNRDGSLSGRPRVVSQSGVTPANEAQKERHAEQAIRAVQLAAPFDLPEEHYASWRRVSAFRFDRKLSQ